MESLVEGLNEPGSSGPGVGGADTAVGDAAGPLGDLGVGVGSGEHGPVTTAEVVRVGPASDAARAVVQPPP